MKTIQEHEDAIITGGNLTAVIQAQGGAKDWFKEAQKYVEFAVKIIIILGKYFFKNGKISAPSLFMFWKYFGLVSELYVLFSEFNKKD